MSFRPSLRVLFTGYAPVHYLCFRPLHERLRRLPGVQVLLSGGLRERDDAGAWEYDAQAMYAPHGVDPREVVDCDRIGNLDVDLLLAGNTKVIRPRSAGTTVQIFHGLSFRNKAVRSENLGCDAYFLVGPYMKRRFADAGLIAEGDGRAVDVGFPKTDRLVDGSLNRARTLHALGLRGDRPVLLYAPTGQRGNSMETMGERVIAALAATGRWDVVIKLHDHPKDRSVDWPARLRALCSDHVVMARREHDVIPLLHAADLLITDASSVSSEFSLTGRPVVFLDVPELLASAQAATESQLDLVTWGRRGGLVVGRVEDVADAVAESLAHPERRADVRRAMARDLFFNPGRATDAAMAWIEAHFKLATIGASESSFGLTPMTMTR